MPSGVYQRKNAPKVYESLPFQISKFHKSTTRTRWKKNGIIFDEIGHTFDWWYNQYIYATYCYCCNKKFKDTRDRHLEHNHHITDKFNVRGVVCAGCNRRTKDFKLSLTNTSGEKYIRFCKKSNKWICSIRRKDNKFHKYCKTKEDAVIERNNYINSQPNFYSI